MNQIVDILCRARELYAAAPSHAAPCASPEPGTRCVIFAVADAAPELNACSNPALDALERAADYPLYGIVDWNAEHSTEEVLAAFDRAITAEGLRVPPLQRTERTVPVHAGQGS